MASQTDIDLTKALYAGMLGFSDNEINVLLDHAYSLGMNAREAQALVGATYSLRVDGTLREDILRVANREEGRVVRVEGGPVLRG